MATIPQRTTLPVAIKQMVAREKRLRQPSKHEVALYPVPKGDCGTDGCFPPRLKPIRWLLENSADTILRGWSRYILRHQWLRDGVRDCNQ